MSGPQAQSFFQISSSTSLSYSSFSNNKFSVSFKKKNKTYKSKITTSNQQALERMYRK
jgi:hypothetical protein